MGQQPRPGAAARNRVRGCRRLGDLLAAPATSASRERAGPPSIAAASLQRLGHVLAELVQRTATAWASRRHLIGPRAHAADARAAAAGPACVVRTTAPSRFAARRSLPPSPPLTGPPPVRTIAARADQSAHGAPTIGRTVHAAAGAIWCLSCSICSAWSRTFMPYAYRSASSIAFNVSTSSGRGALAGVVHSVISDAIPWRRNDRALVESPCRSTRRHQPATCGRSGPAAAVASRSLPAGSRAALH